MWKELASYNEDQIGNGIEERPKIKLFFETRKLMN